MPFHSFQNCPVFSYAARELGFWSSAVEIRWQAETFSRLALDLHVLGVIIHLELHAKQEKCQMRILKKENTLSVASYNGPG